MVGVADELAVTVVGVADKLAVTALVVGVAEQLTVTALAVGVRDHMLSSGCSRGRVTLVTELNHKGTAV